MHHSFMFALHRNAMVHVGAQSTKAYTTPEDEG